MPSKNKRNWKILGSDFFEGRPHRGVGGSKRKKGNKGNRKQKQSKAETISINIFFTIRIIFFLYNLKETQETWGKKHKQNVLLLKVH